MLVRLFDHLDAMADHDHVITGAHRLLNGLFECDLIENSTHVEIVGHDEAMIESQLVAQEALDNIVREAAGPARAVSILVVQTARTSNSGTAASAGRCARVPQP